MQNVDRHKVASCRRLFAVGAAYGLGLVIAVALSALALERFVAILASAAGEPPAIEQRVRTAVVVGHQVLNDEWQRALTSEATWRARRNDAAAAPAPRGPRQSPSYLQGPAQPPGWFASPGSPWFIPPSEQFPERGRPGTDPRARSHASGYRTVCVRLCDGYFFPMSYGGSEGGFSRDQTRCSEACPGSRLYYYRPGSQDAEDMVDLSGQPYSRLKTANLFRTQYVESCKCKPHPWEQASVDRHRLYALEEQRRKGNRAVVSELDELRSKQRTDVREARRQTQEVRRGRSPGSRNDPAAVEVQPATTASQAPRSDASRGQGTEQGAFAPAAVAAGSIVAASAGQSRVQTAALPAVPPSASVVIDAPVVAATPAPPYAVQPEPAVNSAPAATAEAPVPAKAQTPKRKTRAKASQQRSPGTRPDRPQRVASGGGSDWARRAFGQ